MTALLCSGCRAGIVLDGTCAGCGLPYSPDAPESPTFDVIACRIATGEERFLAQRQSEADAEAIWKMAVWRRGVEEEIFYSRPHPHVLREKRTVLS
jgi:hypothetical protein